MLKALSYFDFDYFMLAVFVFVIYLVLLVARKKFNFNIDHFIVSMFKKIFKRNQVEAQTSAASTSDSRNKSLVMLDVGTNKATVIATLRQIMGVDLPTAQNMVSKLPSTILSNVTEKEADINKAALEFVGAKLEIR